MSDDLHALVSEAEDYFTQRDWDLALEKYEKIMQVDPQNEEACEKLARIYAIRGLISNVINQYFTLLQILEDKGELDLALEIARWVMQLQPENDKARLAQINILRKKGENEEVVRQSLQLARLYIELGMGDQSIELLKNAQEMEPDNLDIGYELAEMYIQHGHISEGASQFRQIANSFLEKEQYEKAAEAFKRMKVIQSDDPSLLFTLGNIYVTLGRLNDAEAEFRSILRHDLNHLEALLALGNVCQQKGQFRDAILAFNKILSINPQENMAKEKLGELYQAQGNVNEAIKQFLGAAHAYQQVEENDRAVRLYQRVVALDPTNPTACRELTNLGAPMQPEDPADLGSSYQPIIAPVSGPDLQPISSHADGDEHADDESDKKRGRGRSRAKSDTTGGSSLVRRDGGGAPAAGGKAMLPRPGLMSAKGGGGLVAKGDGGPATLKPRLGGGGAMGGDKPTMGARSRTSEVAASSKPQLMKRGEVDERPQEYDEPAVDPGHDEGGYEQADYAVEPATEPVYPQAEEFDREPERIDAPVVESADEAEAYVEARIEPEPDPEPEPLYDTPEVIEQQAEPVDSGTGNELGQYDPTLFPTLEEPSGREELEAASSAAPPAPVEPAPMVEATEEPAPASSRTPMQPRLLARSSGRSAGKTSRPLLGGGAGGGMRGKADTGKPTLPVRGQQAEPEPVATPEAVPVAQAAESFVEGPPPEASTQTLEQFEAPSVPDASAAEAAAEAASVAVPVVEESPPAPTIEGPEVVAEPPVEPLPSLGPVATAQTFDGARALEELSRAMPENTFGEAGGSETSVEVARLEEYIGTGDLNRAIQAFRQHLQDSPGDFQMRARLADALFVSGAVEEAASEYLQLAHLDPENLAVLHRLVETYLWSDAPERAIDLLVTLSYIHRQLGDSDAAFLSLQDALTIQRENVRARLELAELYRQSEAPDLANWHLRTLAQVADESSDGAAAVETWRKLYEISQSLADQEQLAAVLEKYGHSEEAIGEYRQMAERAKEAGDQGKARVLYERIVELAPGDTEAHEALVAIYQTTGDESAATDKMRVLAERARQNGDLDTAIRLFEDLVRRDPSSVSDRTVVVELYLDKGLLNNARSEAQGLLESWFQENQFDRAIPLLQRFIAALPDDVVAREQLIHFYEKAGESERALEERLKLAHMYVERSSPDEALKIYQKALSLDDRNPQLNYEMGVLYADYLADPAAAEQRFVRVQLLDPSHKDAMRRLVQLQLELGKAAEAVARLSDLIRLAPENASVRQDLIDQYERQIAEYPNDMHSKFTLGLLYRDVTQLDQAIELFQDTRKDTALFLRSCNMLGLCFWERRQSSSPAAEKAASEVAIKWFKRGIETGGYKDEEYLELRYNLAELYNRLNEVDDAMKLYQDIHMVDIHYRDVAEKMKQLDDEMKGGGKVTRLRP